MNKTLVTGTLRIISALIAAGIAFAATATASYAIDPFDLFSCPGAPLAVTGLTTVPASTADNVNIAAGQRLTITITNGASGTIVRTDTGVAVINLFAGIGVGTIDGPFNGDLNAPDIGGGALFATGAGNMDIVFSCSALVAPPPPPPPPPPDPTPTPGGNSPVAPIAETNKPNRNPKLMQLQTGIVTDDLCADFFAFDPAFQGGIRVAAGDIDGDGVAETIVGPGNPGPAAPAFPGAFSTAFQGGINVASADINDDGIADVLVGPGPGSPPPSQVADFFAFEQAARNGVRVGVGDVNGDGIADVITAPPVKCGTVPVFDAGFGSNTGAFSNGIFVGGYYPQPEDSFAPLDAISRYFTYEGKAVRGVVPLQRAPRGWAIDVIVDAAIIDRSFAALNQRTLIGTVILNGHKRISVRTGLGFGLRAGQSVTTQGAATLNSTSVGADFVLAHILAPRLVGALYLGGEVSANHAVAGAVTADFPESNLKVGGTLDGTIPLVAFTVTPSATILMQYHRRPQFADSVGTIVPALDTLEVNGSASLGISRDLVLLESNLMISPFVSTDLLVDHVSTSPVVVPGLPVDPIRLGATAGVRFLWDTGASASIQADASRGATTTVLGWSGTVSIPLN